MSPRPALAAAAFLLLLTGCTAGSAGLQDLPLPGGADLGSHPYRVQARFADVLSLVPQAAVKVNGVAVGRVTDITLAPDDWTAQVTLELNGDVHLPAGSYAQLGQSGLLGEKYVQLTAPTTGDPGATGTLTAGAVIPIARTDRNPEVEEVLGALSMLLNGGGLDQLHTITTELGKALTGNEAQLRSVLARLDTLTTDLDAHRQSITDALDSVDRLSATLATRDRQIGTVLTGLSPGLAVLEQQRGDLVTLLRSLDTLSAVAVDTVRRSHADLVADLGALAPTLQRLADAGTDLPDSLQVLLTYPFTDEVLRGVKGDYLNVYLDLAAAPGTRITPELDPDDTAAPPPKDPAPDPGTEGALPLPLPSATARRGTAAHQQGGH
ncbi:MCE family protein [Kitasatospora sp. MBT63]|uniref:MCE family protein n=1 Tax=Kitasatospora sp. MBT63 TaxID=1444768 RepID=UPI00068F5CA8|nr:MCE family protein [Kitasatospora sp. MBT63]